MSEYQICNRCIMDTSDPDIFFTAQGICNHCLQFVAANTERINAKNELPWIYHEMRKAGRGKKYDCILGLSGGVDSSLCLHYLLQNDIRPLCFTVDNGWNTPESDENIMRLVETLKVPFYRYTLDLEAFLSLQKAFIASDTPNIEIPTDHVLMAVSHEMARKYGLKTIIGGGNLATESIMPRAWGYNARDLTFIRDVYKTFAGKNLKDIPTISLQKYIFNRFIKGIKVINLLDYYEYNRQEAKDFLSKTYGWKDYGEKHCESRFTKWFQEYYLPTRFGYDKRRAHYSSLINSGQMTRAEAVKLMLQPMPSSRTLSNERGFLINVMNWPEIKKTHRDYKNSEKQWDRLTKFYANHKKRK